MGMTLSSCKENREGCRRSRIAWDPGFRYSAPVRSSIFRRFVRGCFTLVESVESPGREGRGKAERDALEGVRSVAMGASTGPRLAATGTLPCRSPCGGQKKLAAR